MALPDFDVIVIGAGVVGCAVARELSRYRLEILVLDKEDDVGCGATRANSGIVHGGYAAPHGTLKGALNVEGNGMFAALDRELHFGYRQTGALVLGFDEEDREGIEALYQNGIKNGVDDLSIIEGDRILELEPAVNPEARYALLCPRVGVASPYELAIALAENALANGARLSLSTTVRGLRKGAGEGGAFTVETDRGDFRGRFVVNAAGVHSAAMARMLGQNDFTIIPRRGQYVIFDRGTGDLVRRVIFQTPSKKGKGVLVTSTFHGNLMIGPNAEEVHNPEDHGTDLEALRYIVETARKSVPGFDLTRAIRTFAGVRATPDTGDFIIAEGPVPGFVNAAGIESPGLTASPAIALRVADILRGAGLSLRHDPSYDPNREPIMREREHLDKDELARRIALEPSPERIVCRCEEIRESIIVDALSREIPIGSTDAVKRRTRAGMGRCQGAFCRPRVRDLIARERGISPDEVKLPGEGSGVNPRELLKFLK